MLNIFLVDLSNPFNSFIIVIVAVVLGGTVGHIQFALRPVLTRRKGVVLIYPVQRRIKVRNEVLKTSNEIDSNVTAFISYPVELRFCCESVVTSAERAPPIRRSAWSPTWSPTWRY
jgi:hypothetical protein